MVQVFNILPHETLPWRHNGHDSVSNHQPDGCLLDRLFRRRSKKASKLGVTGLCVGNSPGPVNSPHKGPVTRKMFPFDDVIMKTKTCLSYTINTMHADELATQGRTKVISSHGIEQLFLEYLVSAALTYKLEGISQPCDIIVAPAEHYVVGNLRVFQTGSQSTCIVISGSSQPQVCVILQVASTFFDFPVVYDVDQAQPGNFNPESMDTMMSGCTVLRISPDGRWVAAGSGDGAMRVRQTGKAGRGGTDWLVGWLNYQLI